MIKRKIRKRLFRFKMRFYSEYKRNITKKGSVKKFGSLPS